MTEKKRVSWSDLQKAEARPITPGQYEEIPELTEEWFEGAELHVGGVKVQRGRPRSPTRKVSLKLRLDPDVVKAFRAGGPGWQSRINAVLRQAARLGVAKQASSKAAKQPARKEARASRRKPPARKRA